MTMKKMKNRVLIKGLVLIIAFSFIISTDALSEHESLAIVRAGDPGGTVVSLEAGRYRAEIERGVVSRAHPGHPDYYWFVDVAIGVDVAGGQDMPNIGRVYFDPEPPVFAIPEAERQLRAAVKEKAEGTSLEFVLEEAKEVRFWIRDFDYTDNIRESWVWIRSVEE